MKLECDDVCQAKLEEKKKVRRNILVWFHLFSHCTEKRQEISTKGWKFFISFISWLQIEEEEEKKRREEEEAKQRKEVEEFERKLEGRKHRRRNRHQIEPEEKPSYWQQWGRLVAGTAALAAFVAFAVYLLVPGN